MAAILGLIEPENQKTLYPRTKHPLRR